MGNYSRLFQFLINPHNKKLWPIAILCGALFGFFYQSTVISGTRDRFKEFGEDIEITKKLTVIPIDIPIKDTYLLKLRGGLKEHNQPSKLFVNNHLLEEYRSERKYVVGTRYRIIPAELIYQGESELKIVCPREVDSPFKMIVSYRNFRKVIAGGKIFLLFDSSKHLPEYLKINKIFLKILIGVLLLGSIWILGSFGLIKILCLSERKIYLYGLISFVPCLLIFSVYYLASIYSPYHIVLSSSHFWTFSITLVSILYVNLILYNLWRACRKGDRLFRYAILQQNIIRLIEWLKSRELSDKLILSFMALLVACALLLILGMEPVAEQFANVAYFALVIGVGIKFTKFIREERAKDEQD